MSKNKCWRFVVTTETVWEVYEGDEDEARDLLKQRTLVDAMTVSVVSEEEAAKAQLLPLYQKVEYITLDSDDPVSALHPNAPKRGGL